MSDYLDNNESREESQETIDAQGPLPEDTLADGQEDVKAEGLEPEQNEPELLEPAAEAAEPISEPEEQTAVSEEPIPGPTEPIPGPTEPIPGPPEPPQGFVYPAWPGGYQEQEAAKPEQGSEAAKEPEPSQGPQPAQQPPQGAYPQPGAPVQGAYYGSPPYLQYPYQPPQPQPPAGQAPPQPYPYYPGYPAYQAQPPQPRQKMRTGVKVFLWIAGLLTVAAVGAASMYLAVAVGSSSSNERNPIFGYNEPFNGDDKPDSPQLEAEPTPDPDAELPQVDITPNTEGIQINPRPQWDTLDAEEVYNRVVPSTVTVSAKLVREEGTSESTGTGIIATSDGYIITNSHVVLNSKSAKVKVTTYEGLEYDAVVVGTDRTTDLAVLKTNDHGFTAAEFGDAGELSVGEWVLAIGNPGGERFSSSLTRGIVSGLDREVGKYSENGMTYIQTDAAINPGNSGGPLVNMYGQVVGINSSKIITEGYEGMGFAIPVSNAQSIIEQLLSGGYVKGRTRLGIMCREISSSAASLYGMPRGMEITMINPDSSFAGTTAKEGDIITAIAGERVETMRDVSNLLSRFAPGDEVSVTLFRPSGNLMGDGQEFEVNIVLLEDKGETQN